MAAAWGMSRLFTVRHCLRISRSCMLCRRHGLCTVASQTSQESDLKELSANISPAQQRKITRKKVLKVPAKADIEQDETLMVQGIAVPKKKKRTSTSILEALASTVKKDPLAYPYCYIDDPGQVPLSNKDRNAQLLARAAGRRAARFIVKEYKNTFNNDLAQPPVPAFDYTDDSYTHIEVGQDALLERIDKGAVEDAIEIYNRIQQQGMELSEETVVSLLELLCCYGCVNKEEDIYLEEQGLLQKKQDKLNMDKAVEVFDTLETKTAETYNWMVRGMAQVCDSRCTELLKEMKANSFPVSVGTYNEMILYTYCTVGEGKKQDAENQWKQIQSFLQDMKNERVVPNRETFHKILQAMIHVDRPEMVAVLRHHVPSVLSEMLSLGFKASLHTCLLVIKSTYFQNAELIYKDVKDTPPSMDNIRDLIHYIKEQDPTDLFVDYQYGSSFFLQAMVSCSMLRDVDVAIELYEMRKNLNSRIIASDIMTDSKFYSYFLNVCGCFEESDVVMKYYAEIVPHLLTPNHVILDILCRNLATYNGYQYVSTLYEDMGLTMRQVITPKILHAMKQIVVPAEFRAEFVEFAEEIITTFDTAVSETPARISKILSNPAGLYNLAMTIMLHNDHGHKAWDCLHMMAKLKDMTLTVRRFEAEQLVASAVKDQNANNLMSIPKLPEDIKETFATLMPQLMERHGDKMASFLNKRQMEELSTLGAYDSD